MKYRVATKQNCVVRRVFVIEANSAEEALRHAVTIPLQQRNEEETYSRIYIAADDPATLDVRPGCNAA